MTAHKQETEGIETPTLGERAATLIRQYGPSIALVAFGFALGWL